MMIPVKLDELIECSENCDFTECWKYEGDSYQNVHEMIIRDLSPLIKEGTVIRNERDNKVASDHISYKEGIQAIIDRKFMLVCKFDMKFEMMENDDVVFN